MTMEWLDRDALIVSEIADRMRPSAPRMASLPRGAFLYWSCEWHVTAALAHGVASSLRYWQKKAASATYAASLAQTQATT